MYYRIDSNTVPVSFYSVTEDLSPIHHLRSSQRIPDSLQSPSHHQYRKRFDGTRRFQSEDTRKSNNHILRYSSLFNIPSYPIRNVLSFLFRSTPPFSTFKLNPSPDCRPTPRDPFGISGLDWQDIPVDVSPSILLEEDQEDALERLV